MKPETRKRAWLISVVLALWPASLFVYQTIVADPRYKFEGAMQVEFFVCISAIVFAVAALVLHTRKSAAGLIISLVLLGAAIACFLNTEGGSMVIYKDWGPAEITVAVDEVGPLQVEFGDYNSDGEFFVMIKVDDQKVIDNIKGLHLCVSYHDLLGRNVYLYTEEQRAARDGYNWFFNLPPCFSGKELTVSIDVTTVDGKAHSKAITVKVPKKPFWSP